MLKKWARFPDNIPTNTHNVVTTSLQRRDVAATYNDVVATLRLLGFSSFRVWYTNCTYPVQTAVSREKLSHMTWVLTSKPCRNGIMGFSKVSFFKCFNLYYSRGVLSNCPSLSILCLLIHFLLTYLLTNLLPCVLAYLLFYLLTYFLTYSDRPTDLITCLPTFLLTYSLTYLLIDLLTYLFTYLLAYLHACLLTYMLAYLLAYLQMGQR